MIMKTKIQHPSFTAELLSETIVSIYYKPNTTSSKEELNASYHAFLDIANGKPLKALYEIGESAYFDIEAKTCLNSREVIPKAEAIVSDSLAIRLVVDVYLQSRSDNRNNIRLFRDKAAALAWLNSI